MNWIQIVRNLISFINFIINKAFDLLKKMLEINPQNRITAKNALEHNFFKNDIELRAPPSPMKGKKSKIN